MTAHPTHAFGNRRPLFSHQALPCAVLWINGMAALVCNASCTKESPTLRLSQPVTAARHVVAPAKLLVVHALVHSVKTSAHIFPPPPPPLLLQICIDRRYLAKCGGSNRQMHWASWLRSAVPTVAAHADYAFYCTLAHLTNQFLLPPLPVKNKKNRCRWSCRSRSSTFFVL